jgi:hypothetical protein
MGTRVQCTVCKHRERAQIDLALARHVAVSAIARRFKLSTDSLYRHSNGHLTPALRAKLLAGPDTEIDLDRLKETESQSLLANLIHLRRRLFAALDVAGEYKDANMLSRVAGQLHRNLELTGKLIGDLNSGNTTTNVLVMPQYVEMRVELVKALADFPDARERVAGVLHSLESKAADQIEAQPRELAS